MAASASATAINLSINAHAFHSKPSFSPKHKPISLSPKRHIITCTAALTKEKAQVKTLNNYTAFLQDPTSKKVSEWEDIPSKMGNGVLSFVVEVPKNDEKYNISWNYGLIANTEVKGTFGNKDSVEVVEIGEAQTKIGDVLKVKALGAIALGVERELDWKIVAISVDDPKASLVNDVKDVEKHFPGTLSAIRGWFSDYKITNGKPVSKLSQPNKAAIAKAMKKEKLLNGTRMNVDPYEVLKYPLTTEHALKVLEQNNTLVFIVDKRADKKMIRSAIEKMYCVKTKKINTLVRPEGDKKAYIMCEADVAKKIGIF